MNAPILQYRTHIFAALSVALVAPTITAAGEKELVNTVLKAHNSTVASMRTASCQVQITYEPKTPFAEGTVVYRREGDVVRCIMKTAGGTVTDTLIKDGVLKTYTRAVADVRQLNSGGVISLPNVPVPGDAWAECLLTFYGSEQFRVSLGTLLAETHELNKVYKTKDGGKSYVVIDLTHKRQRLEIWFAAEVNYLAKRVRMWNLDNLSQQAGNAQVTQFKEVNPGIYFPAQVVTEFFDTNTGKLTAKKSVVISNVAVNLPLPGSAFAFRFPAGAMVVNQIKRKVYKANSTGEATRAATSPSGAPMVFVDGTLPPAAIETGVAGQTTVTAEESRSWTYWFRYAGGAMLLIGVALWTANRLRGRWKTTATSGHRGSP